MPTKKTDSKTDATPKVASMTFADFGKAKETRQTKSQYASFILGMRVGIVYDATGTYPHIKMDTLRGVLYKQARKLGRKISALTRDDNLYVALVEAPGKEKPAT